MGAQILVVALAAMLAIAHGLGITVPGTKWCGPGNIADGYDDLGTDVELDMCCRAHDNCNEKISPSTELHGLSNNDLFPIFSCACESKFRQCLSSLHNVESAALGRIYFSTRNQCFAYGPPIASCEEQQWDLFMKRCLSYKVDESQPYRWQFYDLAFYTHPSSEEN
ncbi:hypothetical protein AWZ03_008900 [Drosophila navojoa]|uniref:Phospholipase A2 n=1 Tax=Drosophila navojoa TaxID=7232 RepID=A0A484BA88_DRONA|nr:phospholipase A2 [Drosophila navojoa]TDG44665.1 hypothetical protein AWZ03_008900 [Drosophila navojoa]